MRAPLLLVEEEGEDDDDDEESESEDDRAEKREGSDDRREGRAPLPLSRAKTSSCGEMKVELLALRVALISFQAFGEVGREPAMSRPLRPRGGGWVEEEEEEEKAKIVL